MGGKRLQQLHVGLVCQSKAGEGTAGNTVAGGKRVGYIWDVSVQAFHTCLFCL